MFFKSVLAISLASAVSAHQNFHQFWVNDVSPGYEAAIRMPPSNSPVTDVTSNDITCNVNGNTVPSGKGTAKANAGDTIKVQWDSSSHPGPIQHFLFGPVDNAASATGIGSWIKIDEFDQTDGVWANEIMMANNMTYEFKLPTGLATGEYLLRSEMLALHGAQTIGGGQFYMGCAQLAITGTSASETCGPSIELPGAYNAEDPSIYIPNIYNGFDITTYTAPGGAVASCGAGSGASPVTSAVASASAPASAANATSAVVTEASSVSSAIIETLAPSPAVPTIEPVEPAPVTDVVEAPTATAAPVSSKKDSCKSKSATPTVAPVSTKKDSCRSKTAVPYPTGANNGTISSPTTLRTIASPAASAGLSTGGVALYGQCGGSTYTGSTVYA
ncbi:putative endo-beta-1,4-glucanase D [Glarea lozoyensis 74030]|uniref:AA9 family lytic polysaccharide monooxygenase n=1 Tax=Glarea lozoyensis (strain ATCC 74030 / MF5533) TaxID=1104152 RepID=H0EJ79_GLAL7|nr:putative endo-beta-1,4-glucanase D [Glarea lozoyensis 74030]